MENLFANTGIGKHIIRTHHWGIVLPTLEKAEAFMKTFGLQEDYRGHVKACLLYTSPSPRDRG